MRASKNLLIATTTLLLAACGHGNGSIDDTIGGACFSDRDCDDRCYSGGDFPNGFCSRPCIDDLDCTDDAYCMAEEGGTCMYYCPPFECARLGPGWTCHEKDRKNGGKANVCSG